MDDDVYARQADAMQQRLQRSANRQDELTAIFAEHDTVIGLYPDPESITRWDKFILKGGDTPVDQATLACLWCRSIDEAMAMARRFGNSH